MVSEKVAKYLDLLERDEPLDRAPNHDPDFQAAVQERYAYFVEGITVERTQANANHAIFEMRRLYTNTGITPSTEIFDNAWTNLRETKQYSALDYLCRTFKSAPSLESAVKRPWHDYS